MSTKGEQLTLLRLVGLAESEPSAAGSNQFAGRHDRPTTMQCLTFTTARHDFELAHDQRSRCPRL